MDTHCHLNDTQFEQDWEQVWVQAQAAGVSQIIIPGVDAASSVRAVAIAERFNGVYAAVGIHPESLHNLPTSEWETVYDLLHHPKVVAVGEVGLDYYWNVVSHDEQQQVFLRQLAWGKELGLPVIVHNRDATQDTLRCIEQMAPGITGVLHCFTGSIETAKQAIQAGFFISYGGPLTFKNAENVRRAAALVAEDRLLVETDAPYLSPHPYRGQRNEPRRVARVAEVLAEIRGWTLERTAVQTTRNAHQLFFRLNQEANPCE
ncbi:TatD family deoxyribonuclease [Alicyclobacillaceae bacterium I2511]|nr:TatD family deoxyribonuclease [Alicyclobacillaceae bacterium I2511]